MTASGARGVISLLNSLSVAELSRVHGDLARAREALDALGQPELGALVESAAASLRSGDVRGFRRAISTVTARLGHLKG